MPISAISFGQTGSTTNSNKQEKSKIGGYAGACAGTAFSAYNAYKIIKNIKADNKGMPVAIEILKDIYQKAGGKEILKITEEQYVSRAVKVGKAAGGIMMGVLTAITVGLGFGLGKIVDKIINNRREKAAAKIEEKPQTAQQETPKA